MKRTKYPIHPDFKKWENVNPPLNRFSIPIIQRLMGALFTREKSNAESEGLPAAYVETAEFDCLRDGGILFAERLRQSGVSAVYNTEGTMHGFDIVLDSPIVRECADRRIGFLKRIFY